MQDYETLKSSIIEAMKNPDSLETSMGAILKSLEEDYGEYKALAENYTTAEKRIRDLQDTNHKLFLSQVGVPDDDAGKEEPEPATGADVIKEFLARVETKGDQNNG